MDVGGVRLDEGSLNQLLTLVQRVQLLLSECEQMSNNNLAKNTCLAEHLKTSLMAKSDVLTSLWVITLTKLWHYLLTWHIFSPFNLVVILNRLFVKTLRMFFSVKRLFDQTLRMFILWKGLLSKLRECLFCEKGVCQNSENVCSLNPGRWASPSPIISATQSAELRTEG